MPLGHAWIQKVLSEWVQLVRVLLVDEGIQIALKSGPSSARLRNAMAFRWRADNGPKLNAGVVHCSFVIFQGIWTSIANKPYIFMIFQGGPDLPPPPLDPSMWYKPYLKAINKSAVANVVTWNECI